MAFFFRWVMVLGRSGKSASPSFQFGCHFKKCVLSALGEHSFGFILTSWWLWIHRTGFILQSWWLCCFFISPSLPFSLPSLPWWLQGMGFRHSSLLCSFFTELKLTGSFTLLSYQWCRVRHMAGQGFYLLFYLLVWCLTHEAEPQAPAHHVRLGCRAAHWQLHSGCTTTTINLIEKGFKASKCAMVTELRPAWV